MHSQNNDKMQGLSSYLLFIVSRVSTSYTKGFLVP